MDQPRLLDGRLKLRHLVLVDVLTTHGSVIAAAAALHITQPVATRTLRDLEAILGVSLYERGPRGVTPTLIGETFTRHARAVLAQLTQAGRHVTELADAHRGTVVVGTDPGGANELLLRAIARLKVERPQLSVVIRENAPEALSVELGAGRLDLIVGRRGLTVNESETQTPLYTEPVGVFARAGHPLALRPAVSFAELQTQPWVIPGVETGLRRDVEHLFARHGMPLPENRIEVTSPLAVRQLLHDADLVGLLPASVGYDDPGLCPLPIGLSVKNAITVTTATGRTASPGAEALITTLRELAVEQCHLPDALPRVTPSRAC
ncbi:LysR substrate-binding domain-containing protein [[Mycobacterium] crassicus]|uniref:LysR substrate-binding domain-containing protein n=1 Tax=[Mycobacterium] crassicus TaxID=2872309 RepID=A0ABU5XIJ2_9MYCO|nr:LysR substrate-binding domain-containing protein [Mycolicibacter sp. MYC098]MEB3021723.1 LysR substrate-binding domain-containing protein [Mycolicibacter sp. MYC098]